jgi:hypothetical protein
MTAFAIRDIQPNPFRHIAHYPIKAEKIDALRESLRTTGYWGNIVARKHDGKVEIAYGHHRLVALKKEYGADEKVDLIIRDLSDEAMLQIMARENMEEWGTCASVEHETIRAVVEAYAEGKVELEAPATKARESEVRHAPSFVPGGDVLPPGGAHIYTATTIARFIGWVKPSGEAQAKVHDALAALQFIEEGILKESDFDGLTTKQAQAVVEQARKERTRQDAAARLHQKQADEAAWTANEAKARRDRADQERKRQEALAATESNRAAKREAESRARRAEEDREKAEAVRERETRRQKIKEADAREATAKGRKGATAVGRAVSKSIKAGDIGYKGAAEVAASVAGRKDSAPPDIEDFAQKLARDLNGILDPDRDPKAMRLAQLVTFRKDLSEAKRIDLVRTLEIVLHRVEVAIGALRGEAKALKALASGKAREAA